MKLVNLVPLKEIDFRNQDQFDDYIKQHELRPDTKVTIAGKVTTAGQAAKNSKPVKGKSVFGKNKGGSVFGGDDSNWIDNIDKIDTSDIKGKADPNADSFTSADLYAATFKDPQTGKTITVGDAYDREDDSPAYKKAFAYVAKFDPDKEAVMGTKAYDDLQKKTSASKYDDKSYWKDEKKYTEFDDVQKTSDRLTKVERALEGDLDLRGSGFQTSRQSSGGGGGWEGPMQIFADGTDGEGISLSIGSPENDGMFSIAFLDENGEEALFEPNYDALTGDVTLNPQQTYKVAKALMKMPEVQKLLKGEMTSDEFEPVYAKLKDKFAKTSMRENQLKLKSLIKRK